MPIISSKESSRDYLLAIGIIVLGVVLLYGHTFHVPFYFDDTIALLENPRLLNLTAALNNFSDPRWLTNLTFALNYRLTGWALAPLHLVNIALHAGCGILVWLLLRRLLGNCRWLPLLGALLFIAHPLQTEGVTYLVQRATTLGAFLFLLAFYFYLHARSALAVGNLRSSPNYLYPYIGAVLAGACAVLAKENTATLPLVLIVYDRLFPVPEKRNRRQALIEYLPFFIVPVAVGMSRLLFPVLNGQTLNLNAGLDPLWGSDPLHYLVTQFTVIWIYLRLLLLPYGQALLHNFPVTSQLLTLKNILGLSGILLLSVIVWRLRKVRPLIALGTAWFFLALAVESSIIPLDPLFEHRLYLPMFGFLLVIMDVLSILAGAKRTKFICGVAILICMPLTWQRNELWNDPISFYQDNLRVTPVGNITVHNNLGVIYVRNGRFEEAYDEYRKIIKIDPDYVFAYNNLGSVLIWLKKFDEAIYVLRKAILIKPDYFEAHNNLGIALSGKNLLNEAIAEYKSAIQINPDFADANDNLYRALMIQNKMQ